MSVGSTAGGSQVADLLEALRSLGADPSALAKRVGLATRPSKEPPARVPSTQLIELLEIAAKVLDDPLLGLHAGAQVETRGPLYYLLLSTPRLADGLRLFAQFARVPLDTQSLQVEQRGDLVGLSIDPGDPAIERSHNAVDYILGANLSSLRRAIPEFQLRKVEITHAEVGTPGETARVFACPVAFECLRNVLWFPDAVLSGVPAAANQAIAEEIQRYTAAVFAQVTASNTADRVADAIRALLVANRAPDRAAVAKQLHVSERTLQRQLEQEATSFKVVRDRVRSDLSRALLSNRALKVETVALSLGFAEVASFSKAFARWSGHSPSRYRAQLEHQSAAP